MKCIILCAGKGTRMYPLTEKTPKCLLKYKGKTLLEHKLDILPQEISEVVLVIGYLGDDIIDYFGDEYRHFKIKYVWMTELNGTGSALGLVRNIVGQDKFLVLMGDDIYYEKDLAEVVKSDSNNLIGVFKNNFIEGRPMFFDDEDYLQGFDNDSNLENTGLYLLDRNYFNLEPALVDSGKEIGIPHTLVGSAHKYKIKKFQLRKWKKINKIDDLLDDR